MREICTSGSVRGGGGNAPTYSASLLPDRCQVPQEQAAVGESGQGPQAGQPPGLVEFEQPAEEQTAKERAQHPHRQEEGRTGGYPALPIRRDAAARHDHVDVRMMRHRRSPGVKHGGDAEAGAEVLRVGRDRHHRRRRRPEQQIIDDGLVLPGDVGDFRRHREDDMEIADRQQVGLALGQPGACGSTLAPGAVPVAATVIGDAPMPAVLAGIDVAAERRRPAVPDRRHDLELGQAQMTGLGGPIAVPSGSEDIGDLDRGPQSRFSRRAPCPPSAPPDAPEGW